MNSIFNLPIWVLLTGMTAIAALLLLAKHFYDKRRDRRPYRHEQ